MAECFLTYFLFILGCQNGETYLGRIVVHDRARVESEVLPRYFNHASFASLRRQLNYFSFTRIGKGRQQGATYCNKAVIVLNDILRLKRRAVGTTVLPAQEEATAPRSSVNSHDTNSESTVRSPTITNSVVPFVHLPPSKRGRADESLSFSRIKKHRKSKFTPIISPISASPVHYNSDENEQTEPRITLDLTMPSKRAFESYSLNGSMHSDHLLHVPPSSHDCAPGGPNDEDILAGCNALLSFSIAASRPVAGTQENILMCNR